MKVYQKILSAVLFVGVLGWVSSVMASPISYSFTEYKAQLDTGVIDTDVKPSPPVSVGDPSFAAEASALDSSKFSAFVLGAISFPMDAFLQATFRFTATFPAIRIQYNYDLGATASYGMGGVSRATAEINSYLKDTTSALETWSDKQVAEALAIQGREDNIYEDENKGFIDKVLALTLGHDYELFLSCSADAGNFFNDYGTATAMMNNIQVNSVPLPPGFVLLSSGLLGILGYRKKLKR